MTTERVVAIDDIVCDEETGEVISWPEGVPDEGRLEWLQAQSHLAQDQEKAWKARRGSLNAVLGKLVTEAGWKSLRTDYGSVTNVAGARRRTSNPESIPGLIEAELLTPDEAIDIIIRAAKSLDVDEVERWIGSIPGDPEKLSPDEKLQRGLRQAMLRAALIRTSISSGYVKVTPAPKPAP